MFKGGTLIEHIDDISKASTGMLFLNPTDLNQDREFSNQSRTRCLEGDEVQATSGLVSTLLHSYIHSKHTILLTRN